MLLPQKLHVQKLQGMVKFLTIPSAGAVLALIEIQTAKVKGCTLNTPDSRRIPVATREEYLSIFLHRRYNHHVPSLLKTNSEYSIAAQRLNNDTDGTVDKAP